MIGGIILNVTISIPTLRVARTGNDAIRLDKVVNIRRIRPLFRTKKMLSKATQHPVNNPSRGRVPIWSLSSFNESLDYFLNYHT